MQHADFVHLHVHSEYSLLDGAAQLDKLVKRAGELRFPALALTDHGNMFGAIDFSLAAQKEGIKPILGCELYVAPGKRTERGSQDGAYEGANHLTVLVRDLTGYRNLIQLVSKAYLEGYYYKPRVDRELLAAHAEGLLVLSGCLNSEVSRFLSAGEPDRARAAAGWYQEVFGRDNYFMEVQAHGLEEQAKVTAATLLIARAIGAPIAGTNDSHYLEARHARAHEALLCIQTGSAMNDPKHWRFSTDEFYVKSADEMRRVFAEVPAAYTNTLAVAERCNLTLEFGRFHLPRYTVPEGHTLETYLQHLAWEGLARRYGPAPGDAIESQLRHELAVIEKMGFAGYFLVVWDFIVYARSRGIAVGPGRGSSAGSLVAYCLGITNVDPIRYGLLFERFLNPERVSMPDMDVDFADDRRDEVIRYVAEKYGRDRVAHIITFGTMGAKAAIRDVGRVLSMPYTDVDRIAKLVPNFPLNITLDEALGKSPQLAEAVHTQGEVRALWEVAKALEGCTRHASVHASAVVISDEPLEAHIPLYRDPKRPELITGYAMGPIEKLGLLKMDFLGLRTLTVLANTVALIAESRGGRVDLEAIPFDDPKTYALLAEAKTFGVFQLESAGMRDALRGLRPERLEDVIAIVSLYRPGPMDLVADFIARKHGRAKISYEHPAMEKFTRETYGIMVYQEQIMQIASELAGFTMGEADLLRRAMGKKDRELMAQQREKFIERCVEREVEKAKAETVWDLMAPFAGYAFNKSHAAAYAVVAYQTAYFKANYPVEFMAALLTSEMGDTDKIVKYVDECRAMGIQIEPPDVNVSAVQFSVAGDTIRFGLAAIKNVGEAAIEAILRVRIEEGRFQSLADFCARVDLRLVNRRVIESLIKAGAFNSIGLSRAHLLATLDAAMESGQRRQRDRDEGQVSLFDLGPAPPPAAADAPPLPEWDGDQLLAYEKEVLGFYISGHPLARYRSMIERLGLTSTGDLPARTTGSRVTLLGQVAAMKEIPTKSGDRMAFVTFEDMDGTIELTVFPAPFRAAAALLRSREPILVRGRVDDTDKGRVILAEEIRPLAEAVTGSAAPPTAGGGPHTCRIRVTADNDPAARLTEVRRVCAEHPGGVPVFLHLRLPEQEVVIRAARVTVDGGAALVAKLESLLGPEAILLEYARRA
ncbi:MAG: DNA polymerase III subunit alpha [Candidatus Rokuibacteriota bacterium]|nr:MAG: DNA polymerase III subunit alpha [Candidatus Rokubacteria bacterium]